MNAHSIDSSPEPDFDAPLQLVWPNAAGLEELRRALLTGWSPDSRRGADAAGEELARIDADPVRYIALQVDREAKGEPIALPDGSLAPRLPGYRRWLWDGSFCGIVNLRWQPGTTELPGYVSGHIGYVVVPWKRRRGYATAALGLMLADARDMGLPFVTITTDETNVPSQRVIERNGGVFVDRTVRDGAVPSLRYRIDL